jgi:hypothetical protein
MNKGRAVWPKCTVLLAILIAMRLSGFSGAAPASLSPEDQIVEKPIKAELQMSLGSDTENEDFFNPKGFTVDKKGRIYILDSGNSRIQCFSPEGKFLFTFGKFGQGPGELSKEATKIKLLEDGDLYVIDNHQRRITVYSPKGEYQRSHILSSVYDDISLRNKKYYLCNLILKQGHDPIHVAHDLSIIDKSFGAFMEPTPGILKKIALSPIPQVLENQFIFPAFGNFTNIIVTSKEEIVYSQTNPYHLVKYSKEGLKTAEAIGQVDFDTHFPLKLGFVEGGLVFEMGSPIPRVFEAIMPDEDRIFVPLMRGLDAPVLYIDVYDPDLRHLARYTLPNIFFDYKKKEGITSISMDQKHNLYCLVQSKETYPRLCRYSLVFE